MLVLLLLSTLQVQGAHRSLSRSLSTSVLRLRPANAPSTIIPASAAPMPARVAPSAASPAAPAAAPPGDATASRLARLTALSHCMFLCCGCCCGSSCCLLQVCERYRMGGFNKPPARGLALPDRRVPLLHGRQRLALLEGQRLQCRPVLRSSAAAPGVSTGGLQQDNGSRGRV